MIRQALFSAILVLLALALAGCDGEVAAPGESAARDASGTSPDQDAPSPSVPSNPLREAYFGDLHVHTILSFDAFLMGTRRTPDDAYEFAKGGAIEHASGFRMQMKKPLDFLGVTDHAFYLGMMRALQEGQANIADEALAEALRGVKDAASSGAAFAAVLEHLRRQMENPGRQDDLDNREVARSAWQEVIEAAERHDDPGRFTTFIGYEYTSSGPNVENLHRNVIFRGGQVPAQPFARLDSLNPEDLWSWMDNNRANGMDAIAIPHNSNGSDGMMFETTNWAGEPMDAAYAELRMRNEPLVENTQVKGTSDTHPLLSPNDEWANFELMEFKVATNQASRPHGSYVREAYLNGLLMEEKDGFNPYRFGVIGSSDTHNAAGSFEEDNYWSKTGLTDIEPWMRGSVPLPDSPADAPAYSQGTSRYWGASGLAGVWAESNTREAIFQAFRRKETFSTSGPHIRVRFFAGFDFEPNMLDRPDPVTRAYATGVPMGGDLLADGERAPYFVVWAARDADSVPLDRLQIIKGWIENGQVKEQVFDVACSAGAVSPLNHRCPDNGATVDLSTCAASEDVGASQLLTLWQDPTYAPGERAFYYVRVLENPKCRWSTWDAIRAGVPPNPDLPATIQDRAWTSPIWIRPV